MQSATQVAWSRRKEVAVSGLLLLHMRALASLNAFLSPPRKSCAYELVHKTFDGIIAN